MQKPLKEFTDSLKYKNGQVRTDCNGNELGDWKANLEDDGRLGWYSNGACTAGQMKKIVTVLLNHNREVIVLSGGHGDRFGKSPVSQGFGDAGFIIEDIDMAKVAKNGKVAIHVISPFSPAIWPHRADIVHGYCFSKYYHHATESACFSMKDTINYLMKQNSLSIHDVYTIQHLFQKIIDL